MHCGLLGEKLGHSYSPQIHSYLGDYFYDLFEKSPEELEDFLHNGIFTGLNVTIPYKKAVIPYLDMLSPRAQALGAVNTIVRRKDGTLVGHNSDYFGFSAMVAKCGLNVNGKKILVLGSGGASATAVAALQEMGGNVVIVSRNGSNHYGNLYLHKDASVIVNATPVGMYPNVGVSPVDLSLFPQLEGVLDVIYNPARTKLLLDAEDRGLITMNGLWMLVAQAKESAEWFTGQCIDDAVIETIHSHLNRQMGNIILVGMPGCGKSTIARSIAAQTGKQFVDADLEIERLAGVTIPEIFATEGEAGFRLLESQVLSDLGKQSSLVIATGGGCVTREENYRHLHQNGTIYWIQRELHALPTDGRPLSQVTKLQDMYQAREPMYRRFADHVIQNNDTICKAIESILEKERLQ